MKTVLFFVVDATASMSRFTSSLTQTLTEILSMSGILFPDNELMVRILVYRDYSCKSASVLQLSAKGLDRAGLLRFISRIKTFGGGSDCGEACKTAFNKLYHAITTRRAASSETVRYLVVHYTDDNPHLTCSPAKNARIERELLNGKSPLGSDWLNICSGFRDQGVPIITVVPEEGNYVPMYALLGSVLVLKHSSKASITHVTMGVVLHLIGESVEDFSKLFTAYTFRDDMLPRVLAGELGDESVLNLDAEQVRRLSDDFCATEVDRRLKRENAATGDFVVSLMWFNRDDLDLHVTTPANERIFYESKTSRCGGCLDVDMNVSGESEEPVENVFWRTAIPGVYKIYINQYCSRGSSSEPVPWQVFVTLHGKRTMFSGEWKHGMPRKWQVAKFEVTDAPPLVVEDEEASLDMKLNTVVDPIKEVCTIVDSCDTDVVLRFAPDQHLVEYPRSLGKQFRTSEELQTKVFECLKTVFVPEHILAVTYNAVIGKMWRLCCKCRHDPRLEDLRSSISSAICRLEENDAERVRQWIEDSYNNQEEVNEIVEACAGGTTKVYMLDPAMNRAELPSLKKLRDTARVPDAECLSSVQRALTQILHVEGSCEKNVEGDYVDALPDNINNYRLFSMLSHLIHPGTTLTLRPAAVVAVVAWLSQNLILKDRAHAFLTEIRGKWIHLDDPEHYPESLAVVFVRLLTRDGIRENFLTASEAEHYTTMLRMLNIKRRLTAELIVKVPFSPARNSEYPDNKTCCARCRKYRSNTVMVSGVCGVCINHDKAKRLKKPVNTVPGMEDHVTDTANKSRMVECKDCHAIYGITNVDALSGDPRCYYCRNGLTPPKFKCETCLNEFVDPNARFQGHNKPTKCAVCVEAPELGIQPKACEVKDIIAENKSLCSSALGVDPVLLNMIESSNTKLSNTFRKYLTMAEGAELCEQVNSMSVDLSSDDENKAPCANGSEVRNGKRARDKGDAGGDESNVRKRGRINGKPVHEDMITKLSALMEKRRITRLCMLCFEDCPMDKTVRACGSCDNFACLSCLETWYETTQPGKLVLCSRLLCPFCKRVPKFATLKTFNKWAARLMVQQLPTMTDLSVYYGWCSQCNQIKSAMPKECGGGDVPTLKNFTCELCLNPPPPRVYDDYDDYYDDYDYDYMVPLARNAIVKKCPKCSIMFEKTFGCDHMTCSCGAHFCFKCLGVFSRNSIYDHIYECRVSVQHGAIVNHRK